MEKLTSQEGFRSTFEFYDAEERKFKELAEEARRRKQEVLIQWKKFRKDENDTAQVAPRD